MKGLGLVHHILKCHRIGHKFVVDDGLFLISRVIRPEMTASTEGQVLGELVVSFDFGCVGVWRCSGFHGQVDFCNHPLLVLFGQQGTDGVVQKLRFSGNTDMTISP